jgi:hypothetical protein
VEEENIFTKVAKTKNKKVEEENIFTKVDFTQK